MVLTELKMLGCLLRVGKYLDMRVRHPRSHETDLNKDPTHPCDSIWWPSGNSCPIPVVCNSKGAWASPEQGHLGKKPSSFCGRLRGRFKECSLECVEGPVPSSWGTLFLHSQSQLSLSRSSATALTRHLRTSLEAPTPQSPPPSFPPT